MASKYWIKLYHEIIHDPKMMRMPEVLFARCLKLFLLAGDHDQDGMLPSIADISWLLRIDDDEVEETLTALQELGITLQNDESWSITNWDKRQGPVSGAERSRKYRQSQSEKRHSSEYQRRGPAYMGGDERVGDESATIARRGVTREVDIDIDKEEEVDKDETKARQNVTLSKDQTQWTMIQAALRGKLDKPFYETWVVDTWTIGVDEDRIIVGVANSDAQKILTDKLTKPAEKTAVSVLGRKVKIEFQVEAE